MRLQLTLPRNRKGFFTLPELLVVVAVVLVLSLIAIPVIRSTRVKACVVKCMTNLRNIALATSHYQREHKAYPPQPYLGRNSLKRSLGEFVRDDAVFLCPVDEGSLDSYSDFYVTRTSYDASDSLLVGCPRHNNQTLAVNVFKKGSATTHPVGQMFHSEGNQSTPSHPGDIVGSGTTWFPDGSSMTITTPGLEAEIVESFRLENGQTYTLIKVPANDAFGRLILSVIPGSKFEVITPAAIAGVRGTVFMVDIFPTNDGQKAIDVFVYEGKVAIAEKSGKGERLSSWNIPIRCEPDKPPYRSPAPIPELPGIPEKPNNQAPEIPRENPPWAMGNNPWAGGPPPWAPAKGKRDGVEEEPEEVLPPGLAKKDDGEDDATGNNGNGNGPDDDDNGNNGNGGNNANNGNHGNNGADGNDGDVPEVVPVPDTGAPVADVPPAEGPAPAPAPGEPQPIADLPADDTLPGDGGGGMENGEERPPEVAPGIDPDYRIYAIGRGGTMVRGPWERLGFLGWVLALLRLLLGI